MFNIMISIEYYACVADVTSSVISDLSKHIDLKYQFMVDNMQRWNVKLRYVRTDKMPADVLTKNLSAQKFEHALRLLNIYYGCIWMATSRGGVSATAEVCRKI